MKRKPTIEERALESLLERMGQYEEYFKSTEEIDNSAQTAYIAIVKAILAIAEKMPQKAATGKALKEKLHQVMKEEYGIER